MRAGLVGFLIILSVFAQLPVPGPISGGGGGGGTGGGVTASGTLASTEIVTGAGTTVVQTPSANATVDSNGNLVALSLTAGGPTPANSGIISLSGKTSGIAAIAAADAAGTAIVYVMPSTNGSAGQVLQDSGSTTCPTLPAGSPATCHLLKWVDSRDKNVFPFAACPNGVAAAGVSYAAASWTVACRAGTNNKGGALQLPPNTGGTIFLQTELPADWDTTNQPFIRIVYAAGANTSGTVIWQVGSACTKSDGSVTDDPAFNTETAFGAQTMAAANRMWAQTGQFTAITSGNNCIAGSTLNIELVLSGTASSAINGYQAVLTIPTLPAATQAE